MALLMKKPREEKKRKGNSVCCVCNAMHALGAAFVVRGEEIVDDRKIKQQ